MFTGLHPDQSVCTEKKLHYWETGARQISVPDLRRLAAVYRCRTGDLLDDDAPAVAEAALAVVAHAGHLLLVQRADTLAWQLPAATVKPGHDPERALVREVHDETGVAVLSLRELGARVHPATKVWCRYFACRYLAGDPVNGDPTENAAALWAPVHQLTTFVPTGLYEPVMTYLGGARV